MAILSVERTWEEVKIIWNDWKKENKVLYKTLRTKCSNCPETKGISIHHIDFDKTNNSVENLKPLCWSCHRQEHWKSGTHIKYLKIKNPECRLNNNKNTILRFRCEPSLYNWIKEEAKKEDMELSEFLRFIVRSEKIRHH